MTREAGDHLAFGFDRHLCLGAHLARSDGEIAFRALLGRYPTIRLDDTPLEWLPNAALRGLKALPVTLH